MNTRDEKQSRVLKAFCRRSEKGIPDIISSLLAEARTIKLSHSGVGPESGNLQALTFTVQATLEKSTEHLWQLLEPRIEKWLKTNGARNTGHSAYRNEETLEVDIEYSTRAACGILTLVIAHLKNGRTLIHGRVCESKTSRRNGEAAQAPLK